MLIFWEEISLEHENKPKKEKRNTYLTLPFYVQLIVGFCAFCGILLSMIKMTANITLVMTKTKAINIQILKTHSFLPLLCWHIFVFPQWSHLMDIFFEILTKTETEFVFEYFVLAVLVAVQVYVPESVGWRLLNVRLDLWWGSSICSSDLFSNRKLQVKTGGGLLSALHSIVRESPT